MKLMNLYRVTPLKINVMFHFIPLLVVFKIQK